MSRDTYHINHISSQYLWRSIAERFNVSVSNEVSHLPSFRKCGSSMIGAVFSKIHSFVVVSREKNTGQDIQEMVSYWVRIEFV